MTIPHQQSIAYLEQDVLKHIVHLKMLHSYGSHIESFYEESEQGTGVLLLLPTSASVFDTHLYPKTEYVVMPATEGEAMKSLLRHLPKQVNLVFKFITPHDRDVTAQEYHLQRVTAFVSYTNSSEANFIADAEVVVSEQLDERCLALYVGQGYKATEMKALFASNQAVSFSLFADGRPISTCFVYRNFANVWEIGAVQTVKAYQRRGYARRIVGTALHYLQQRNLHSRYQVQEDNHASIALAEQVGLTRFLVAEHFLHNYTSE